MDSVTIDIGRILIEGIETEREFQITYKQLGKKLSPQREARTMDSNLGNLSDMCKELGLPLISVVVVNADTRMPGPGFFRYFFGINDEMESIERYIAEYKKVIMCTDWNPLRQQLGLAY